VDKTGTNAVFDVSTGINVGDTNVVYFTFSANSIVFKGKEVIMPTGIHLARTDFGMIFFHLHVETNGIPTTDLYFEGLNEGATNEKPGRTTGTVTVHDKSAVAGDGTLGDATWTVIKGKVTGSGSGRFFLLADACKSDLRLVRSGEPYCIMLFCRTQPSEFTFLASFACTQKFRIQRDTIQLQRILATYAPSTLSTNGSNSRSYSNLKSARSLKNCFTTSPFSSGSRLHVL